LPHKTESMLVSGAFFEGAGRVPGILARHGVFMKWAQQRVPGIQVFDHVSEIPALLAVLRQTQPTTPSQSAKTAALENFGWNQCKRVYAQFYQGMACMPPKKEDQ
jgi:beta-1,4-mannosyltransferase